MGGQQSAHFFLQIMKDKTLQQLVNDLYDFAYNHGMNSKGLMCELTRTDQPKQLQEGKIKEYKNALAEFSDADGFKKMMEEKMKKIAFQEVNNSAISCI